nr:MAG: major capsid protein [Microviridae sp.]
MKREIGGGRLGSGSKLNVEMREYGRSSHDIGYLWRSSMAAGTLVPFLSEIALPGDTFDIDLDAEVRTHPTLGPLFGSYKVQLDVFQVPIRLYNAQLHNNELGIGMSMQNVIFPQLKINSPNISPSDTSYQINPSNILSYLGIKGLGYQYQTPTYISRNFNAMPLLAYWDIFKNYYANKQETNAYIISATPAAASGVTSVKDSTSTNTLSQTTAGTQINTSAGLTILFAASTVVTVDLANIIRIQVTSGPQYQPTQLFSTWNITGSGGATPTITFTNPIINTIMLYWVYYNNGSVTAVTPQLKSFALANIDTMRTNILQAAYGAPYIINNLTISPYGDVGGLTSGIDPNTFSQQGLAIKTYQSDRYNNWMATSFQTAITAASQVSTAGSVFTIDQLNLATKVYKLLNRIGISGGSYEDWIETVYTDGAMRKTETPIYEGGLSKEVLFQEVVAMANSTSSTGQQNLGTQAGKGVMGHKHKGGHVVIHVREPAYIMGIVSITPRIDYSQGNKWDINLQTMNDLHKPQLDEIGFQNLVTDEMASWDTLCNSTNNPSYSSAGLQPAWIQYMTNTNKLFGNFAIPNNEMFMTLNRRYTQNAATGHILDLTTYIDPTKFNFIFAQTSLDAQNFWTQIACNITARRVISAKVIPNL